MTRDEFLAAWADPIQSPPADESEDATIAFTRDLDALLAEVRREALTGVRDAIEAASRANQAKADAAQESGDLNQAAQLILWGGGIVEALLIVRKAVPR